MRILILFAALLLNTGALADHVSSRQASKRIQEAVDAISPLAESGVRVVRIKPARTVRDALMAVALKEKYIEEEKEFIWAGRSSDAWGADTMSWGEATMKEAYSYMTELDDQRKEILDEKGNEKEKAKIERQVKKAKEAFELFMHTGVQFGLAPMGAVQCGVTFAALAIIDPHSGKVYLFSKEDSGC